MLGGGEISSFREKELEKKEKEKTPPQCWVWVGDQLLESEN